MRPSTFAYYLQENKVKGEDLIGAISARDVTIMSATVEVCVEILNERGHRHAANSLRKRAKELFEEKA